MPLTRDRGGGSADPTRHHTGCGVPRLTKDNLAAVGPALPGPALPCPVRSDRDPPPNHVDPSRNAVDKMAVLSRPLQLVSPPRFPRRSTVAFWVTLRTIWVDTSRQAVVCR